MLLICLFIGSQHLILAQKGREIRPAGARSTGLAHANSTLADAWAVFNNIGALARIDQSQVFFGYDHRLHLEELTTLAAGMAFSGNKKAWGISLASFGGEHFSQQKAGLGISHQLGIASLGFKANFLQTSIENFGTGSALIMEFGGVAELSPELFFGARIYNFNRGKYGRNSLDYLPTQVQSGLSYRPSKQVMVNVEVEKDILLPAIFRAGVEYNLLDKFWCRAGIINQPSLLSFGIGFRPRKIHLDYAVSNHPNMGYTHHFSFNYLFLRR